MKRERESDPRLCCLQAQGCNAIDTHTRRTLAQLSLQSVARLSLFSVLFVRAFHERCLCCGRKLEPNNKRANLTANKTANTHEEKEKTRESKQFLLKPATATDDETICMSCCFVCAAANEQRAENKVAVGLRLFVCVCVFTELVVCVGRWQESEAGKEFNWCWPEGESGPITLVCSSSSSSSSSVGCACECTT